MANLSSASGTVTLTTTTKEDLKDFLFLHVLSEKDAYYDTTIEGIDNLEPTIEDYEYLDTLIDEQKENEIITDTSYKVTFSFFANGRWNFKNNLEWFFDCLKKDYDDDAINALRKNLETQTITAFFDFIDYESGCNFIADEEILLTYTNGKTTTDIQVCDTEDFTVQNLIDKDIYEPNELISEEWLKENYDDFAESFEHNDPKFYQWLKNHKNNIYPHLTNDTSVYFADDFEAMLENNDNITVKEITYA